MTSPAVDGDDLGEEGGCTLVAAYEQLRSAALGAAAGRPGRGLAVLMRSGLIAWMQAAYAAPSPSGASPASPSASPPLAAVPQVAAPEMVTILTQMVMAHAPESRS